jgi:hypothetical protein
MPDDRCTREGHAPCPPSKGLCPLCGEVRCVGESSQKRGQRCRNRPIRGAVVCSTHGGNAPQVKAAAAARVAQEEAAALVKRLLHDANAPPITDPGAALAEFGGVQKNLLTTLGRLVDELGPGAADARALLTEYRGFAVLYERLLADMKRLGLAERVVELEEAQAQIVFIAFGRALDVIDGLRQEQRDLAAAAFMAGLRASAQIEGDTT